jgi:hypothetical protein
MARVQKFLMRIQQNKNDRTLLLIEMYNNLEDYHFELGALFYIQKDFRFLLVLFLENIFDIDYRIFE